MQRKIDVITNPSGIMPVKYPMGGYDKELEFQSSQFDEKIKRYRSSPIPVGMMNNNQGAETIGINNPVRSDG